MAARRDGFTAAQGALWGSPPEAPIPIDERGRRYEVDLVRGQKSGFYLDQRDARDLVERLSRGRRVLDLFSYTGGFAVAAARGGAASVTLVDSSADALHVAARNLEANVPALPARLVEADAFRFVRQDDEGYDLIVLDPPPLAKRKGDVARAARAHKDVLLFALRRAAPDALVLAFSCSHAVDATLFRQIVFGASLDAGRSVQVLATLGAPSDHPVSIDHPEGSSDGRAPARVSASCATPAIVTRSSAKRVVGRMETCCRANVSPPWCRVLRRGVSSRSWARGVAETAALRAGASLRRFSLRTER